jgi:exo-1,4-beta-D-glucosaminidase
VRVRIYDIQGQVLDDRDAANIKLASGGAFQAMTLPRFPNSSPVYFVRCQLSDNSGKVLAENIYWQSQKDDDLGDRKNDGAFALQQASWADMTALNSMPQVPLELSATQTSAGGANRVAIRLHNATGHVAFFERAEITPDRDGDEILPIEYDDNYVTVFPGETAVIHGVVPQPGKTPAWVRLEGYNTPRITVAIK